MLSSEAHFLVCTPSVVTTMYFSKRHTLQILSDTRLPHPFRKKWDITRDRWDSGQWLPYGDCPDQIRKGVQSVTKNAQLSPYPFPCEKAGSGDDTNYIGVSYPM